jgi:hypothetical protein
VLQAQLVTDSGKSRWWGECTRQFVTDAISNVLKLGIANNSDMHEEKFLLSDKIFRLGQFEGADKAWPMLPDPRNWPSRNGLLM